MAVSRQKYRAKPTWVGGIRFASKREAARYLDLLLLEKAGEIKALELQPKFPIEMLRPSTGEVIACGRYTADFVYYDVRTGAVVIEDVKSSATATEAYRLRKRLVEAQYAIQITETR